MTGDSLTGDRPLGRIGRSAYARPIVEGLVVAVAGLAPWAALAPLNRRLYPELPWGALLMAAWLVVLLAWLHGAFWPRRTSDARRERLRLWPPIRNAWQASSPPAGVLVLLLALLYVLWVLVGTQSARPDLSAFPTTSYRWSSFIMGGVMSGVVEEAAYRGYMQTGLERIVPGRAVAITSIVFVLSHLTQGLTALVVLAPGLFAASMLYGALAQRTGTILPGMLIHVAGDLAYTWLGVLRGDAGLLFVR
jgi:membrane protease YdiL (CAAX protease family)